MDLETRRGLEFELAEIAPWHVGKYFEELAATTSIATRNQHLSALRHFFDGMVVRRAIALNPALSVRGERYSAIEVRRRRFPSTRRASSWPPSTRRMS